MIRAVVILAVVAFIGAGCTSDPTEAVAPPTPAPTVSPAPQPTSAAQPAESTVAVELTLADETLASITQLASGEQAVDTQGNLISIYGVAEWPRSFEDLSDESQANVAFFGDVEELANPSVELVALDVGICTAGIDAAGFGTAEFFVHDSPDDVLSVDPVLDRGVLAHHPVLQPGFDFPSPAECVRGWLPVLWSGAGAPSIARYVVATRSSATAEVERHVYQWAVDRVEGDSTGDELFGIGQTVTFNDGALAETTVVVDGWAELVGASAGVDGTRAVGVSLTVCPSSAALPFFGLSVDGWNLIAPNSGSDLLGALSAGDPTSRCFEGWLEFAVPFGGVPTGFFASDGDDPVSGYAQWSLENAALPAPQ